MSSESSRRAKLSFSSLGRAEAELVDDIMACVVDTCAAALPAQSRDRLKQRITERLDAFERMREGVEDRDVAILISDLRGFTAMSEAYSGDQVIGILNRYFTHMNEVIARYDGIIDKYIGDAILVLFGVREKRADDLHRAVACAVEMQLMMDTVNAENHALGLAPMFMGIGINAGTVTAGALGSDLHFEYSVIGDEVNLTSRIEAQTLRGQILIGDEDYARVADQVEVSQPNEIMVKGRTAPLKLYEVQATRWPRYMTVPRREYRSCPRIELDAPFKFQLVNGKQVLPKVYHGRVKDLGYHGMFALIPRIDQPVSEIKVSIALSILSGESRDIYGRIQTVRKINDQLGCSVEFTSTSPECERALKDFVDRIISGNKP